MARIFVGYDCHYVPIFVNIIYFYSIFCSCRSSLLTIDAGMFWQADGHRVRLATHSNFEDFVLTSGLEFFPLGGDPKVLAACEFLRNIYSICFYFLVMLVKSMK